ncbi:GNAT family N-acetyltransferase [Kineosporia babensis]|uniref:N-acetyltransferase family protein n=1 Tax=Kineosporia babensis TaxID=499548 RepID=A0A9X1N7C9_9ACTN|nr:GNAT family N-acetyltransferase [Kineosporia babensis]MCD5309782.1 N-acetyltransferase family protein [Kineosporia babensis]
MSTEHLIRSATPEDAAACAAIYAPYVLDTTISFEEVPPTPQEMASRMAAALEKHAWLVLEDEWGRVIGYAYGGPLGKRAAYRWSCEVSVYLDQDRRGKGGGRALYQELLVQLEELGFRQALALVSVPNEASIALHERLGFHQVGRHENVGFKHGKWLTIVYLQRSLGEGADSVPTSVLKQ